MIRFSVFQLLTWGILFWLGIGAIAEVHYSSYKLSNWLFGNWQNSIVQSIVRLLGVQKSRIGVFFAVFEILIPGFLIIAFFCLLLGVLSKLNTSIVATAIILAALVWQSLLTLANPDWSIGALAVSASIGICEALTFTLFWAIGRVFAISIPATLEKFQLRLSGGVAVKLSHLALVFTFGVYVVLGAKGWSTIYVLLHF